MKNKLTERLRQAFEEQADAALALPMEAYMKGHFPFYGIQAGPRQRLVKPILKAFAPSDEQELCSLVREMWQQKEREWQYAALLLLEQNRKYWTKDIIVLFEELILSKSWWDSVDTIASRLVGPYFLKFPDQKHTSIRRWRDQKQLWLNRVCIIHQLGYKEQTDTDCLASLIAENSTSGEFFIQKAIGWALRQYARTNPGWVRHFVDTHPLKPLSRREALKNLND